jgi:hypothetical protein
MFRHREGCFRHEVLLIGITASLNRFWWGSFLRDDPPTSFDAVAVAVAVARGLIVTRVVRSSPFVRLLIPILEILGITTPSPRVVRVVAVFLTVYVPPSASSPSPSPLVRALLVRGKQLTDCGVSLV